MTNSITYVLGILFGMTLVLVAEMYLGIQVPRMIKSFFSDEHVLDNRFARGSQPDFSVKPKPVNIYERVDPRWTMTTPDQESISLHAQEGKVLFMSRWATWCSPCIAEMPEIARLRDHFSGEEVAFMLYTAEQEHTVRSFVNEYDLPIYNSTGILPAYLRASTLPTTLIVDKKGVVRYIHRGAAMWDDQGTKEFIDNLLSE